jgi:hypothetical protein
MFIDALWQSREIAHATQRHPADGLFNRGQSSSLESAEAAGDTRRLLPRGQWGQLRRGGGLRLLFSDRNILSGMESDGCISYTAQQ